ncbi:MAG: DUF1294 domain-containing protein [Planctomycetota bacterium]
MPLANATWFIGGYAAIVAIASCISFLAYGWDKFRAKRDRSRVPEKTLHLIDLVGGWPGGLLARRTFRHKTVKRSFVIVFWLTATLHVLAVVGAVYLWIRSGT